MAGSRGSYAAGRRRSSVRDGGAAERVRLCKVQAPNTPGGRYEGRVSDRPMSVRVLALWQFVGRFRGLPVNHHMWNEHQHAVELLKPSEVAVQLGVSRTWLYDAAKAGRIPAIRIGGPEGPLRFVPEDIQRWIDDARAACLPGGPAPPTRSALNRLSVTQQGTHGRPRSRR